MDWQDPLLFFTDPVLRAPTLASMLMCLAAGLVGVVVLLRKQSLLGESLSHAAYPGVIIGVIAAGTFLDSNTEEGGVALFILAGAFLSALLGLWAIHFMERKLRVRSDSALCFVLASFFGIGITLASEIQFSYTTLYKQVQVYLYGQAATMTDIHVQVYGALAVAIIIMIALLHKELKIITLDRSFAKSLGIHVRTIDTLFFTIVVLAVVVGIRSVGVVLMSAMLIAPPAAARQCTNHLSMMFTLSGFFGLASGFLGNYFSVQLTHDWSLSFPSIRLAFPTGPMIVIAAAMFFIIALLFAPERGILLRFKRAAYFRYRCICENILKTLWHGRDCPAVPFNQIAKYQQASSLYLRFIMQRLVYNGWVDRMGPELYRLTSEGQLWAAKIVRLHRLWEVYLFDYVGVDVERVHRNAEEMEHIITPDLEQKLVLLLKDPKEDPHHQPIPSEGEF
jgi:manganese/zinc/iron transport system permease protein